jgi:hypothetical protein
MALASSGLESVNFAILQVSCVVLYRGMSFCMKNYFNLLSTKG